jgi:phage-related protein
VLEYQLNKRLDSDCAARVRGNYHNFVIAYLVADLYTCHNEGGGGMPLDELFMYRTASGKVPLKDWLNQLATSEPRALGKCLELINYLNDFGPQDLNPPRAKRLGDGILELRTRSGTVQYRILFFFCGTARTSAACMSHGFKKGGKRASEDPNNAEIEEAKGHRNLVLSNRDRYTEDWEEP